MGNDDRVLLAVARGLGRVGLSVDVGWCDPKSPAMRSRYVDRFHDIESYDPDDQRWIDSLNEVARENRFDLVIPCNDFAVVPLQHHRAKLDSGTRWYLLNEQAFDVAFDKSKTGKLAANLGVNVPREYTLSSEQAMFAVSESRFAGSDRYPLRFPVYVKPRSSITRSDVANKRPAERVESPSDLAATLCDRLPEEDVLIQEAFAGVGIGVEVLADDGEILMQMQHRRLRETIDGGSTYRECIEEIPDLTEATAKMVERLKYSGVGMFEFRYNEATGQWVFLEINARFWGSLPLAIAAGVNFPAALYEWWVNGRKQFHVEARIGTRCRNLIKDLRAYRRQRTGRIGLAGLVLGREHLDFFAVDDWRPQLAVLGELVGSIARKVTRR